MMLIIKENKMEKTEYENLEISVVLFDRDDVIMTSCTEDQCHMDGDIA